MSESEKGGAECPSCSKKFKSGEYLWVHYSKVHLNQRIALRVEESEESEDEKVPGAAPHVCPVCGVRLSTASGLKRHIHSLHGEDPAAKKFLCSQCPNQYKTKNALSVHVKDVHLGENFPCDICSETQIFRTAGGLWKHKRNDHGLELPPPPGVNINHCEFCKTQVVLSLQAHVRKVHPEKFEEFRRSKSERRKKKVVKNAEYYSLRRRRRKEQRLLKESGAGTGTGSTCEICGKELSDRSKLLRHKIQVHGMQTGGHLCPEQECGKAFITKSELTVHLVRVHDEVNKIIEEEKLVKILFQRDQPRVYICAICNTFRRNVFEEVKIHLLTSHESHLFPTANDNPESHPLPTLNLNCRHCSETFDSDNDLRSHLEESHSDKCWRCPACAKVMISPPDMSYHFKTCHSSEYEDYAECDAGMRYYTVPRRVQTRTNRPFMLRKQQHKCKRCPNVCANHNELLNHMRQVHPENCFVCSVCQIVKFTERGMKFHVDKSHRREEYVEDMKFLEPVVAYDYFKTSCKICSAKLSMRRLREHLKKIHGVIEDSSLFICKVCGADFARRNAFLTHMEEDHGHEVDMEEYLEIAGGISCSNLAEIEIKNPKGIIGKRKATANNEMDLSSSPKPGEQIAAPTVIKMEVDSDAGHFNNEEIERMKGCFVPVEKLSCSKIQRYVTSN